MRTSKWRKRCIVIFVVLTGILARTVLFGQVPDGLNQDEAFAGYEAWNILTTGHDTMGYYYPLYLFTNGGGMNALETYLMIPFLAIFGMQDWVIRIPQVIVAILSFPAMYGVVKRVYNERAALWSLVILAWCPWHIMLSRWGLESNLAPGMLLFGLYFLLRGTENRGYYVVAAIMYGLSLYSYAMIWKYVPFILLISIGYLIYHNKIRLQDPILWLCVCIVGVMAIPLVLVVLINYGYMGEVATRFLSVPKLDFLRTEQTDGYTLWDNLCNLCGILFGQSDGLRWNSPTKGGLYYSFGIVFIVIGTIRAIADLAHKLRHRVYAPELLIMLQLVCGVISGCTSHVNVNRVNIIFIPMLMFGAYGIDSVCRWQGRHLPQLRRAAVIAISVLYIAAFARFEVYYFTEFNDEVAVAFDAGLKEALEVASKSGKTIHVDRSGIYQKVLYYLQVPVDDYIETRVFSDWHPMPQSAVNLYFDMGKATPDPDGVYILSEGTDYTAFTEAGFECTQYKACLYLWYPE